MSSIQKLDLEHLNSKVVLITGASRGIGRAIAEKLLNLGNIVIGTSREVESLSELSTTFKKTFYPVRLELNNPDSVNALVKTVRDTFGKLDVLINNAGTLGEIERLENCSFKTWNDVLDINLNNQFLLIKSLLPYLKLSTKGSIINLSSTVGREPRADWGAYAVSKAAIEALSTILAQELEDSSVIVNTVNPGGTATAMRKEAFPNEDPSTLPLPDDILAVFLYLCSDSATETGQQFDARDYIGLLQN